MPDQIICLNDRLNMYHKMYTTKLMVCAHEYHIKITFACETKPSALKWS